jgi:hypothetical protein
MLDLLLAPCGKEKKMRIEQVIQNYTNRGFGQSDRRGGQNSSRSSAKRRKAGCVDMLCISPEQENDEQTFEWILAFVHLIDDDRMNEWVRKNVYQSLAPDEALIEKLLIEAL